MQNTLDYAILMDSQDSLASYRERFYIPKVNGKDAFTSPEILWDCSLKVLKIIYNKS